MESIAQYATLWMEQKYLMEIALKPLESRPEAAFISGEKLNIKSIKSQI